MRLAWIAAFLVLAALSFAAAKDKPDVKEKSEFTAVGDLNAEVSVLNVLHALQATPAQLKAMAALAKKTMQPAPPRKLVKVSEDYRKTLASLREALIAGDDEKISDLFAKFNKLQEKEDPELDDVEMTDDARKRAPALLKAFSARQVGVYLATVPEIPDPMELLVGAMEESRKRKDKEWRTLRDEVASQTGWLIAGMDTDVEEKIREKATALLDRVARLSNKDFTDRKDALEKEARALVGKLGPTDILRHYMERVLAETLSNHRLIAAVEALRKKAK